MRIDNIIIEDKIKEKILSKHNVRANEVVNVLLSSPLILMAKAERYMVIGYHERFLTVIFDKQSKSTNIITAYPPTTAQIRLYKKKKGM